MLGVVPRTQLSVGVQQWGLELVASVPYQEAAARLETLTGLALGPETLRRLALRVGTALAEPRKRRRLRWSEPRRQRSRSIPRQDCWSLRRTGQ